MRGMLCRIMARRLLPIFLLTLALCPPAHAGAHAASGAPAVPPVSPQDAPQVARATRVSGTVLVEALVDETGHVRATGIARSQPVLDDEAAARVAALVFAPLIEDGKAVASLHTIPVTFTAPPASGPADAYSESRCNEATFTLDVDARADSSGQFNARWTGRGLKSQELFVIVLFPDGAEVDTTQSWYPQRFRDAKDAAGWPAWHREGREVRLGTSGSFSFRLPETPWWHEGRIAVVALFRDLFDGRSVLRQRSFRIERDEVGSLLVGDPGAISCAAGPSFEGR